MSEKSAIDNGSAERREYLKWESGVTTRSARSHNGENEDSNINRPEMGLFAVFDGMGGEEGGAVASRSAAQEIAAYYAATGHSDKGSDVQDEQALRERIVEAITAARVKVLAQIGAAGFPEGATTATIIKTWKTPEGKTKALVANLGDSRAYAIRNGRLMQLTYDDNMVDRLSTEDAKREEINKNLDTITTKEEYEALDPLTQIAFKRRNIITHNLEDGLEITDQRRIGVIELKPGDKILICTDGIHDNLTNKEIEKALDAQKTPQELSSWIVRAANERSQEDGEKNIRAKDDDMTAIVVEFT
jgi:protein phosphatase